MRRKINFKGRVQGVGFRWNSKDTLKNYNVKGYVKNLPDGTVELLLEGSREDVTTAMEAVEERMRGHWSSREYEDLPGESHWANFTIQY